MSLTPRQVDAYLEFSNKLDRIDRRADLIVSAIGSQGDKKTIEKMLKDLSA